MTKCKNCIECVKKCSKKIDFCLQDKKINLLLQNLLSPTMSFLEQKWEILSVLSLILYRYTKTKHTKLSPIRNGKTSLD